MLEDCIEIFEKELDEYRRQHQEDGEISFITDSNVPLCLALQDSRAETSFITDGYALAAGTYYLLNLEGEVKERLDVVENLTNRSSLYEKFAKMEYLSMYVDSNKPVADKIRKIFSNNIYSFIAKKKSVSKNGKDVITEENIDKYYNEILALSKCKDSHKRVLYIAYEEEIGTTNAKNAEKAKEAVKKFLAKLDVKASKERLAIFFDVDFSEYKKEGYRYIIANVFNNNKYNYQKQSEIFGLPNNNMGLNDNKPYLENRTRKKALPYALSQRGVMLQKLFFDYLLNLCSEKKQNIYFTEKGIKKYKDEEYPKEDLSGFFMRIQKGKKGCEILDCSMVLKRTDRICVNVDNILRVKHSDKIPQNLNYKIYTSLNELINVVNEILYGKWLEGNYFTDTKDIRIKNDSGKLKQILLKTRNLWVDWFYKGKLESLKREFSKFSMEIIRNSIENSYILKAREQYNLRFALMSYFEKKENMMSEKIKNLEEKLTQKINSEESKEIESDDEFYFAVGQVANYFISLNKSSEKTHSLVSPIFQCKSVAKLKRQLNKMFLKYSYAISTNSLRFNNLYGMINRYDAKDSINFDMLIGGYLFQSLIYKKNKKENNNG